MARTATITTPCVYRSLSISMSHPVMRQILYNTLRSCSEISRTSSWYFWNAFGPGALIRSSPFNDTSGTLQRSSTPGGNLRVEKPEFKNGRFCGVACAVLRSALPRIFTCFFEHTKRGFESGMGKLTLGQNKTFTR